MRVGISGHQRLPPEAVTFGQIGIEKIIFPLRPNLTGLSSLAAGADQLFATIILQNGGSLHVIIPCQDYEKTFSDPHDLEQFRLLVKSAKRIETLEHAMPSEDAFLDAGRRIVDASDILIALWDGKPAKGKGGTADIVEYARFCGKQVQVIWPPGIAR